jgi:hypothetical protein
MTTNTHDVQRRQPERDTLQAELQTYLDSGKMIEILGPTPVRHHHPRDYKYASDKS